jgi:hypothetical protein
MKTKSEFGYEQVFCDLGRPLRSSDGEPEKSIRREESRLGIAIPAALRTFYRVAGRATDFNAVCDRFRPPSEWTLDGNHLIFAEEQQVVVLYGVRIDKPELTDPPVLMATRSSSLLWYKVSASVSEFASVYMLWNATFGGAMECVGSALATRGVAAKLRRDWLCIGEVNRMRAYLQPSRAACYLKWNDGWRVFVGTCSEADMCIVANELGIALER